jgi:hypothetical protein
MGNFGSLVAKILLLLLLLPPQLSWENRTHFQKFVLVAPPKTPTLEPPKIYQPIKLLWETMQSLIAQISFHYCCGLHN